MKSLVSLLIMQILFVDMSVGVILLKTLFFLEVQRLERKLVRHKLLVLEMGGPLKRGEDIV